MTVENWLGLGVLLIFFIGLFSLEVHDHGLKRAVLDFLLTLVILLVVAVGVGLLVGIINF